MASVALLAGELVFLFAPGEAGISDAIWWAFLWLTDPGYLGDDEGLAARTISTTVTVLGYVLFMGLLIAIMTQWLNQWIARLETRVTPAAESHHILMLGWTHLTPAIANVLLETEGHLERFLARQSRKELTIVILVNEITPEMRQELREQLGTRWNNRQILLRAGSPQRIDHLQRVAYEEAAVIILPGADFTSDRPGVVDAETIKTLLSISTELESGSDIVHAFRLPNVAFAWRASRPIRTGRVSAVIFTQTSSHSSSTGQTLAQVPPMMFSLRMVRAEPRMLSLRIF